MPRRKDVGPTLDVGTLIQIRVVANGYVIEKRSAWNSVVPQWEPMAVARTAREVIQVVTVMLATVEAPPVVIPTAPIPADGVPA